MILAAASEAGCASGAPSAAPDSLEPDVLIPSIPPPAAVPVDVRLQEMEEEEPPAVALCVTSGKVESAGSMLHVDASGMRAVLPLRETPTSAELSFVYGGASAESAPLANGEERRQIGLKLRAQDTCNLVYVMWRLDPTPGVFVSVKHNPGAATHAECGDRGYINLPASRVPIPAVGPGERHRLRAELSGRHLRVFADDELAWEDDLPAEALAFDGPPGIRSDNVRFDFELRADARAPPGGVCPPED